MDRVRGHAPVLAKTDSRKLFLDEEDVKMVSPLRAPASRYRSFPCLSLVLAGSRVRISPLYSGLCTYFASSFFRDARTFMSGVELICYIRIEYRISMEAFRTICYR